MKLNLSSSSVLRSASWVVALQRQFADEHDIKFGTGLKNYIATPGGAKSFANWLAGQGYKATFWCINPHIVMENYNTTQRKIVDHIGFGVEFDDKCPLLTEIKLKQ